MQNKDLQKAQVATAIQEIIDSILSTAERKIAVLPSLNDFKSQEGFWNEYFKESKPENLVYYTDTINCYIDMALNGEQLRRATSGQSLKNFIASIVSEREISFLAYSENHSGIRREPFDPYRFFCTFASQNEIKKFKSFQKKLLIDFNVLLLQIMENRHGISAIEKVAKEQGFKPEDIVQYIQTHAYYFSAARFFSTIESVAWELGWPKGTNIRLVKKLEQGLKNSTDPFNGIEHSAKFYDLSVSNVVNFVLNNPKRFRDAPDAKKISVIFGLMSHLYEAINQPNSWVRQSQHIYDLGQAFLREAGSVELTSAKFGKRLR